MTLLTGLFDDGVASGLSESGLVVGTKVGTIPGSKVHPEQAVAHGAGCLPTSPPRQTGGQKNSALTAPEIIKLPDQEATKESGPERGG
jgi:hypothetical protein